MWKDAAPPTPGTTIPSGGRGTTGAGPAGERESRNLPPVRRPIWYSEVHGNWCMGRDPKRVKPGILHGLRGNECAGEFRGNEFGENYAGTKYRSATDKSPSKIHKSGS